MKSKNRIDGHWLNIHTFNQCDGYHEDAEDLIIIIDYHCFIIILKYLIIWHYSYILKIKLGM